ncbi:MAG: hypothetical protein K2W92_02825 [Alphaproteobacteria bacterium]|nr:hypothetical protein [Alphaproteobacteria bacterium]
MIKRGDKVSMTNPRTGLNDEVKFLISSDFDHPRIFSTYLVEIYLNNHKLFKEYVVMLFEFLKERNNNLTELEILENKSIVHGINGFYFARDKEVFEEEEKKHKEFSQFFSAIIEKRKG